MKNSESLKDFKKLNPSEVSEKIDQLRKDLFNLRFKQLQGSLMKLINLKKLRNKLQLLTSVEVNPLLKNR